MYDEAKRQRLHEDKLTSAVVGGISHIEIKNALEIYNRKFKQR